jgi:rhomboid protease GluP
MHCGRKNPGMWGFRPELQRLFGHYSGSIPVIIFVSILFYVISLLIDVAALFQPRGLFSLLGPSNRALIRLGMTGSFAMARGHWWTMVTAIYLHGGLLHILFNMLWIRQLGFMVEDFFGAPRTFIIYTVSGIFSFYLSNLWGIPFTVGASGAVFGLLGALVRYGQRRGGTFGTAVYRQVGMWALILFMFGFMWPGVNNIAHAGGFIGGYLLAIVLSFREIKPETDGHRAIALACALVTVISFVLVIFIP